MQSVTDRPRRSLPLASLLIAALLPPAIWAEGKPIETAVKETEGAPHQLLEATAELFYDSEGEAHVELLYDVANTGEEATWGHGWKIEVVSPEGEVKAELTGVSYGELEQGQAGRFSHALTGEGLDAFDPSADILRISSRLVDMLSSTFARTPCNPSIDAQAMCESVAESEAGLEACAMYCRQQSTVDATGPYCAGVTCQCHPHPDDPSCKECHAVNHCSWDPTSSPSLEVGVPDLIHVEGGRPWEDLGYPPLDF